MDQQYLNLANCFNKFAYELVIREEIVKKNIKPLEDDVLYRRVIFNKYYYALYHKYLAYDNDLRNKNGSSKHDAIRTKIKNCGDPKLFQVFEKLLALRIWADYEVDDSSQARTINLTTLNQDVWKIIKRESLNC